MAGEGDLFFKFERRKRAHLSRMPRTGRGPRARPPVETDNPRSAKSRERTQPRPRRSAKSRERTQPRPRRSAKSRERTQPRPRRSAKSRKRTQPRPRRSAKSRKRTQSRPRRSAKSRERTRIEARRPESGPGLPARLSFSRGRISPRPRRGAKSRERTRYDPDGSHAHGRSFRMKPEHGAGRRISQPAFGRRSLMPFRAGTELRPSSGWHAVCKLSLRSCTESAEHVHQPHEWS